MWNLTIEAYKNSQYIHALPIPESEDEWQDLLEMYKEDGEDYRIELQKSLKECKHELLKVLPKRFVPYVENGTLNQPHLPVEVRTDYLNWVGLAQKDFENVLDAAYENTEHARNFLPSATKEVFEESLHDGVIERIEREGANLHIYLNMDGGFTAKARIHLTFKDVLAEQSERPIQVGHWFIYHELQKTAEGFALRVVLDCPETLWTIEAEEIEAAFYYRPAAYHEIVNEEKLEETLLPDFIVALNLDFDYTVVTPDFIMPIKEWKGTSIVLEDGWIEGSGPEFLAYIGDKVFNLGSSFIPYIFTNVYEDPYAHFSEPVPTDELEDAVFSEELALQVRAWNTLYANPEEHIDLINRALLKMQVTEDNEMMVYVYVGHFKNLGILSEENIKKYSSYISD